MSGIGIARYCIHKEIDQDQCLYTMCNSQVDPFCMILIIKRLNHFWLFKQEHTVYWSEEID